MMQINRAARGRRGCLVSVLSHDEHQELCKHGQAQADCYDQTCLPEEFPWRELGSVRLSRMLIVDRPR
jgi:hypothetical protein